jgi:polyhydroxybutyrate depolymerase
MLTFPGEHSEYRIVLEDMIAVLSLLMTVQSVKPIELTVDGVERTGVMVVPAKVPEEGVPLVFAWHGHGGGARQAQRSFAIEKAWPEAAVIYLQGLNTPGRLTDPEGKKPGWQGNAGEMEDRDLKLFDAALAWAKKEVKVGKVFTMGHSNGGGFSYLLWMSRPNTFAAIGVSAGGFRTVEGIKPVPLIHIGGTEDPLVRYTGQSRAVGRVRTINQCEDDAKPWGDIAGAERWESKVRAPVVFVTHGGGHEYWNRSSELIVKFFKDFD